MALMLCLMIWASHPARGAWIEIGAYPAWLGGLWGRTPQGVRGLKSQPQIAGYCHAAVAPRKGRVD